MDLMGLDWGSLQLVQVTAPVYPVGQPPVACVTGWLPKHTMHHMLARVQRRPLHAQHGVDDGAHVLLKMTGPQTAAKPARAVAP